MKLIELALIGLCTVQFSSYAQDAKPAIQSTPPASNGGSLRVTTSVNVPFNGWIAGRAKCDGKGDIFVRLIDNQATGKRQPISTLPIRKLQSDGTIAVSFRITDTSPDLRIMDFFVTASGDLFVAARSDAEPAAYVVSYSDSSPSPKVVRLQTDSFVPYQIAVFKTGEFLLSGLHGSRNRTPYTAVFEPNGKLIKNIYEPEDEDARQRAERGEADFRPGYMDYGNHFLVRGDAVLGSDGNVYLLRSGSTALVYVISHTGQVARKLKIDAPSSGLVAERLKSVSGRLAIAFLERGTNQGVVQIVDYEGKSIDSIANDDSRMYPGLMGCYSAQGFAFLQVDSDKGLHIHMTEPK